MKQLKQKSTYKWGLSRLEFAALVGLFLAIFLGDMAIFGQSCDAFRPDTLRLHIMANSDSAADQETKLFVRDRILENMSGVFSSVASLPASKAVAQEQLDEISHIASEALADRNINMTAKVELCNMYFTTRQYDTYTLPAGMYDAVRVTLGKGEGQNWWCVLYPPVCIPAAIPADSLALKEMEALELIDGQPMLRPKLAIVELYEAIKNAAVSKDLKS